MSGSERAREAVERFRVRDFEPGYLGLLEGGELDARASEARERLGDCRLCPRACGVNRLADEMRFCRTGLRAIVSSAFPHHGEEDCLRGSRGSGTIFFSSCNLRCVFCQNADISHGVSGEEVEPADIAGAMLGLQQAGCHNINFVTPSHVVPQILEAVAVAARAGLRAPLVYNTNAYDCVDTLRLLDGVVDIYMPDAKFSSSASARRLSKARDYPDVARAAIAEMHRQVGPLSFGEDDVARRGVLVRHLVMPGHTDDSVDMMRFLASVSEDTWINIMAQYRPANLVANARRGTALRYDTIARRPTRGELDAVYQAARANGLWRFDERQLASSLFL
jgi:putative pyruvate formate lyase activating enzyme